MNIDMRNIDSEFEQAINTIINEEDGIAAATKAVRYATLKYHQQKEEIENLNRNFGNLELKLTQSYELSQKFKSYFNLQTEIHQLILKE